MTKIEKKLKTIISQHLGIRENEITPSSHFIDDLNASPLEIADLMVKLENIFNLKISDQSAQKFNTVGDLLNYILDNIDGA